jgi:hypothetical protein
MLVPTVLEQLVLEMRVLEQSASILHTISSGLSTEGVGGPLQDVGWTKPLMCENRVAVCPVSFPQGEGERQGARGQMWQRNWFHFQDKRSLGAPSQQSTATCNPSLPPSTRRKGRLTSGLYWRYVQYGEPLARLLAIGIGNFSSLTSCPYLRKRPSHSQPLPDL